jgi:ABC-type multidrug transport system ATPase subunit
MVRRDFRGTATVLTIAHRLHTICFYDAVIVLDKGAVVEQGPPLELLKRPPRAEHGAANVGEGGGSSAEPSSPSAVLRAVSSKEGDLVVHAPEPPPCACPGAFRRLADESGDYENLVRIAEEEQRGNTGGGFK